jgi:hypothetical protein
MSPDRVSREPMVSEEMIRESCAYLKAIAACPLDRRSETWRFTKIIVALVQKHRPNPAGEVSPPPH